VVVATIRALKMHGGMQKDTLKQESVEAVEKGFANLARHIENVRKYGVPVLVGVNRFSADTDAETAKLKALCEQLEVQCITSDHWARGGAGAADIAHAVVKTIETTPSRFQPLYPDDMPLWKKAQTIAREIYGADDVIGDQKVRDRFKELQDQGYGHLPICVAKTQYSFTTDPDKKGAPKHHVVPIREVRLSAGAEFVVAICGDIMTMPGLPKVPSANKIDVTPDGRIVGLF
jgi:formate--tetrahydrofolate ligase